jgi:hypothetical protein
MRARATLGALAFALVSAVPASADTIAITGGSMIFNGSFFSPLTITGERGFMFDATAGTGAVEFNQSCGGTCAPGTAFSLEALWNGADLGGRATIDGRTFEDVGGLISNSSAQAHFTGTMMVPLAGGLSAMMSSPFAFDGALLVFHPEGAAEEFDFVGHGTATGTFGWQEELQVWNLNQLDFEFADVAATPEPASLLLVATGVCGALGRRRQSRLETRTTNREPVNP